MRSPTSRCTTGRSSHRAADPDQLATISQGRARAPARWTRSRCRLRRRQPAEPYRCRAQCPEWARRARSARRGRSRSRSTSLQPGGTRRRSTRARHRRREQRAAQLGVLPDLPDRICSKRFVEAIRVRLLDSERPEQPDRTAEIGRPLRAFRRVRHQLHRRDINGSRELWRTSLLLGNVPAHYLGGGDRRGGADQVRAQSVLLLNWRDTTNPEGGGSERYVEEVARGLAALGWSVTVLCAAYPGAPRSPSPRRTGTCIEAPRSRCTYAASCTPCCTDRTASSTCRTDSHSLPCLVRRTVVVLVHHVHQEQWQVVYPGWRGRLGWWLESRVAPRLNDDCPYVTVSSASRDELAGLGVSDITVIHNGTDPAPPRQRSAIDSANGRLRRDGSFRTSNSSTRSTRSPKHARSFPMHG